METGDKVIIENKTTKVTLRDGTVQEFPMKVTTTEKVNGERDVTIELPRLSFAGNKKKAGE
jgi:hypothetical protein